MAGEPIIAKLSHASGNNAPIDGLKVIARSGWFAARPSGTEAVYKIYAESFKDEAHLDAIVHEARKMVNAASRARAHQRSRAERPDDRSRSSGHVDTLSKEYRARVLLHVTRCPRVAAYAICAQRIAPAVGSLGLLSIVRR